MENVKISDYLVCVGGNIYYRSGNNQEIILIDKTNIDLPANMKVKMQVKYKKINDMDLMTYIKSYEVQPVDISCVSRFFNGDKEVEEQDYGVFKDFPNLMILTKLLDKSHYANLSLFQVDNWLISNENRLPDLPFYFFSKEDFNLFRKLKEETINYLCSANSYNRDLNAHGNANLLREYSKLSLFFNIYAYNKQQVAQFGEESHKLLVYLFELAEELNKIRIKPLISSLPHLKAFYDEAVFVNKFLFKMFIAELFNLHKQDTFKDGEMVQARLGVFKSCIAYSMSAILIKHIHKLKPTLTYKMYADFLKYYDNIDKQKSFNKLLEMTFAIEKLETEITMKTLRNGELSPKSPITIHKDKFIDPSNRFEFEPLIGENALYKEGNKMGNCIAGRFQNTTYQRFTSNNLHIIYHVVDKQETGVKKDLSCEFKITFKDKDFKEMESNMKVFGESPFNDFELEIYEIQFKHNSRQFPKDLTEVKNILLKILKENIKHNKNIFAN